MYSDHMNGLDWLWGSLMMGFWIVVIALVVYVVVRMAQGDRHREGRS